MIIQILIILILIILIILIILLILPGNLYYELFIYLPFFIMVSDTS